MAAAAAALTSKIVLDSKAAAGLRGHIRQHSARLPTLLPSSQIVLRKTALYSRRGWRGVVAMTTGETPAEVSTELPEIVTTIQETWDKLEDKYAVATLAFVGIIGLWSAIGMISAIDRLPIVPGVLELVGIGYTGWFVYSNLVFEPDREVLVEKVKSTYSNIIGNSTSS